MRAVLNLILYLRVPESIGVTEIITRGGEQNLKFILIRVVKYFKWFLTIFSIGQ